MSNNNSICSEISPSPSPSHRSLSTSTTTTATNPPKYGTMVPNRIFVGGIATGTGEAELINLFSAYGGVKEVKIINDRAGVSKGYGFVTFETEEEAKLVLKEADNIVLKDRKLNIAPAVKKQPFSSSRNYNEYGADLISAGQIFYHNGVPCTFQNGATYVDPNVALYYQMQWAGQQAQQPYQLVYPQQVYYQQQPYQYTAAAQVQPNPAAAQSSVPGPVTLAPTAQQMQAGQTQAATQVHSAPSAQSLAHWMTGGHMTVNPAQQTWPHRWGQTSAMAASQTVPQHYFQTISSPSGQQYMYINPMPAQSTQANLNDLYSQASAYYYPVAPQTPTQGTPIMLLPDSGASVNGSGQNAAMANQGMGVMPMQQVVPNGMADSSGECPIADSNEDKCSTSSKLEELVHASREPGAHSALRHPLYLPLTASNNPRHPLSSGVTYPHLCLAPQVTPSMCMRCMSHTPASTPSTPTSSTNSQNLISCLFPSLRTNTTNRSLYYPDNELTDFCLSNDDGVKSYNEMEISNGPAAQPAEEPPSQTPVTVLQKPPTTPSASQPSQTNKYSPAVRPAQTQSPTQGGSYGSGSPRKYNGCNNRDGGGQNDGYYQSRDGGYRGGRGGGYGGAMQYSSGFRGGHNRAYGGGGGQYRNPRYMGNNYNNGRYNYDGPPTGVNTRHTNQNEGGGGDNPADHQSPVVPLTPPTTPHNTSIGDSATTTTGHANSGGNTGGGGGSYKSIEKATHKLKHMSVS